VQIRAFQIKALLAFLKRKRFDEVFLKRKALILSSLSNIKAFNSYQAFLSTIKAFISSSLSN
jgi:hypothetical protein